MPVATSSAPSTVEERLFDARPAPGEEPPVTLEDLVLGALEDLAVHGRAACPVCGGELRAAAGCQACGSDLS